MTLRKLQTVMRSYVGDLITAKRAKEREADYEKQKKGVFLYFFSYMDKKYCIDATKETSHLGRLINHSKANANLQAKIIPDKATGNPMVILVASKPIEVGQDLSYDYGERRKNVLDANTFLKT